MTTKMGPLVSREHRRRVESFIERAVGSGATLVMQGDLPSDPALADGAFVPPTIVETSDHRSEIAREEVFGPVLTVMRWCDDEEVLHAANDVEFGLTASVWTSDLGRSHHMASRLEAGRIFVNSVVQYPRSVEYGHFKNSGTGEAGGLRDLYNFTRLKAVHLQAPPPAAPGPGR